MPKREGVTVGEGVVRRIVRTDNLLAVRKRNIEDFIECFHNQERLHSALHY